MKRHAPVPEGAGTPAGARAGVDEVDKVCDLITDDGPRPPGRTSDPGGQVAWRACAIEEGKLR